MVTLVEIVQENPLEIMVGYEPRIDGPYYSTNQVLQYLQSVKK